MKKTLSAVLALILLLSLIALAGCSEKTDAPNPGVQPGGTGEATQNTEDPNAGNQPQNVGNEDKYAEMYAYLEVDSVPDPEYTYEK